MRSKLNYTVKSGPKGLLIANARVDVFAAGTADPEAITGAARTGSMWSARTGGVELANPLASSAQQAEVEAWFDVPQTVDLVVSDNLQQAYLLGAPSKRQRFDPFVETVEVGPAPEDVGLSPRTRPLLIAGTRRLGIPGCAVVGSATRLGTASRLYFTPFVVSEPITISSIVSEVTIGVAASTYKRGIVKCSADGVVTGNIRWQDQQSGVAAAVHTAAVDIDLEPGYYFSLLLPTAGITLRVVRANSGGGVSPAFGSSTLDVFYYRDGGLMADPLPDPNNTGVSTTAMEHFLGMRFSAQ